MNADSIRMYLAYCSTLDDATQFLIHYADMLLTRKRHLSHLSSPEIDSTAGNHSMTNLSRLAFFKDDEVDEMLIKALILRKAAICIA